MAVEFAQDRDQAQVSGGRRVVVARPVADRNRPGCYVFKIVEPSEMRGMFALPHRSWTSCVTEEEIGRLPRRGIDLYLLEVVGTAKSGKALFVVPHRHRLKVHAVDDYLFYIDCVVCGASVEKLAREKEKGEDVESFIRRAISIARRFGELAYPEEEIRREILEKLKRQEEEGERFRKWLEERRLVYDFWLRLVKGPVYKSITYAETSSALYVILDRWGDKAKVERIDRNTGKKEIMELKIEKTVDCWYYKPPIEPKGSRGNTEPSLECTETEWLITPEGPLRIKTQSETVDETLLVLYHHILNVIQIDDF